MAAKISVKLGKDLYRRAREAARVAGYSSAEELIEHAIEAELAKTEAPELKETVIRKLKGLGYLG